MPGEAITEGIGMEVIFLDQGTIVLLIVGEKVHCHPSFRTKNILLWFGK